MTNVLVIKAHPLNDEQSTSMKVLSHFTDAVKVADADATIEILDLYNDFIPELDGPLLMAFNALKAGEEFTSLTADQQKNVARFNELTELFLNADKIIIGNALWNLNIPTRLKAWVDTINVAGKTFHYTATGPAPLTSGKKAVHIQSSGGSYNGQDYSTRFMEDILKFVGVADVQQIAIEGIDHHPEERENILAAVFAEADAIAKTF
ncbi:FMN-dependent NADH-azoreductase [Vagococcus coleopterorum]|uniref:FMN dependent NADH:quinone oxidoreductase n=1 Tax=Vagococcus coleopterorum TaxID=2714946 RepID=A0A6G8AN43_9ENTE|nr:NAD(P)H-dependent oxidoreductase [Vagococcus coleopterorum]QIL46345.1 FMN-dependent NADH-azoreductase [Vagococcus coleopterorum]